MSYRNRDSSYTKVWWTRLDKAKVCLMISLIIALTTIPLIFWVNYYFGFLFLLAVLVFSFYLHFCQLLADAMAEQWGTNQ